MVVINIQNYEVPKNCDNCDLMRVEGDFGSPTCPFFWAGIEIKCASTKPDNCPLTEISKGYERNS